MLQWPVSYPSAPHHSCTSLVKHQPCHKLSSLRSSYYFIIFLSELFRPDEVDSLPGSCRAGIKVAVGQDHHLLELSVPRSVFLAEFLSSNPWLMGPVFLAAAVLLSFALGSPPGPSPWQVQRQVPKGVCVLRPVRACL